MKTISDPGLAEQAIGIISADYYDADRANLKALAFSAEGQQCAYLPDSTPFKKDKQNVRDGHYPIWGPIHFFTAVSDGGARVAGRPGLQQVSIVSVPNIPQALLDAFIGSSLVPSCAMAATSERASSGRARRTTPSLPVRLLLRGEPRRERLGALRLRAVQHRQRLQRSRTARLQPRLLRSPMTSLEAP